MKLKKYIEFKKINESLSFKDDIESFISKVEYLVNNFYYESYCDNNIYEFNIESKYINDVEDELRIYNFDITRSKEDTYISYILMPIGFKDNYKSLDMELFEKDKTMNLYRFKDDKFSCIFGDYIFGYEVWGDSDDPQSGYTEEQANIEYLKWQYNKKQITNDNITNS